MASSSRLSRTSPPRKPLHERSDSHTNERISPTLRIIGDPNAQIYNSSPFPTLPAHILPPKAGSRQGAVFEDDLSVSDDDGLSDEPEHDIPATAPLRIRKSKIIDEWDDDGSDLPLSSTEYPSTSSTAQQNRPQTFLQEPNATNQDLSMAPGMQDERVSDEIVQLPSVPKRGEALGSHRYTQDFTIVPAQAPMVSKSSDNSLSSAGSTGTMIRTKPKPSRGSYSAFPNYYRPSSSKSNVSSSASLKPTSDRSAEDLSPTSSGSPISPILSAFSTPDTRRTPSIPAAANFPPMQPVQNGITIQYPIVRPPTASGSWAESTLSAPTRPPRAANRNSDRWNPHLSVVHSDEMEDGNSGTLWLPDSRDVSAANSSSYNSTTGILAPPQTTYSRPRDTTNSTIRAVREDEDDLTALPEPVPGSRNSGYYTVQSANSVRDKRHPLQTRPSSRGSFLRDSIPAWARVYYGRPSTNSRPPTSASNSSENIATGISRPRNRPHTSDTQTANRDSMAITPADNNVIVESRDHHRRKPSQVWSPHLWQDRRSFGRRRSLFKAPSVNDRAEGLISRRNMQIFLFALGFIFPFGWFIASCLPLPPKPNTQSKGPERRLSRLDLAQDLEKALGHVNEARYENARWWRNLNRLMSLLGVIILAAIITLAVVAVRMRN